MTAQDRLVVGRLATVDRQWSTVRADLDRNISGFRAQEEFAFNAEPYIRTGRVQKVIGL